MKVFVVTKKNLIIAAITAALLIIAALISIISSKEAIPSENNTPTLNINSSGMPDIAEYEVSVFAGLMKELPVYNVDRQDKKIALTIDAAWADDKTEFILSTLNKYRVKATFFLCGFWAEEYPEMVKAIDDAGHQIGNHSSTHPHMNQLGVEQIKKELNDYDDLIESIIGKRTTIFRAPFGEYNDVVIKTVRDAGYEVIQWNIDTIDWKEERSAETILNWVLPKLKPGSIILCHNNGFKIEQYLPTLIETALAEGYEFVTIDDLLLDGSTVIDVNGVQKSAE